MNQNPSVGGRGKRAPYATQHIRIPCALKSTVEVMSNAYKELVSDYDDPFHPELIADAHGAIASAGMKELKQKNLELTLELVQLQEEIAQLKLSILSNDSKELVSRILKQSLKLKANSDESTKDKIRDILTQLG